MPSSLRYSTSPSSPDTPQIIRKSIASPPPAKKQKMSLTQTYYLAHTARGKLSKEAARADHDLRLLVGHANLLDGLMVDLADAEREQESWFNQTIKGAAKASEEPEKPKHIQWADTIPEQAIEDEDWDAEASDDESDSDSDDEEVSYARPMSLRRTNASTSVTAMEIDEDEDMEEDDEFEEGLTLTRTSSNHPPELLHESDSESDDDSMPPSPEASDMQLALSEKQRQAITSTSFYPSLSENSDASHLMASEQEAFFDEGFYIPQRQPGLVSAVSVY